MHGAATLSRLHFHMFPDGKGLPLSIIAVDSATGQIKGLRVVGMSSKLSNALHKRCREYQGMGSFDDVGKQKYNKQLE